VPTPTFPAHGFVHAAGASVLLGHVTEYELVDGRDLALTILRSTGLISRNANPFREDPAGPEVPVPNAQLVGPWSASFALLPHAGTWEDADVLGAAEAYRVPVVVAPGRGSSSAEPAETPGLSVEGRGVVLSALRRRDGELELRLVAETPAPTIAVVRAADGVAIRSARTVDLLGRPLATEVVEGDGSLRIALGAWEIRTLRIAFDR
jgi:alpha-mannosidase